MKNMIIASTSTIHGGSYLDYLIEELKVLYENVSTVVFVPYARPGGISHDEYLAKCKAVFSTINIELKGLHNFEDPIKAIKESEGIFIGGGNTFVLVDRLYRNQLIQPLKDSINNGVPYLGTSAGSNICGLTMKTTNDMPIVYPESFNTLGSLPFNINPHYLDPDPNSEHMGETREMRISEFHKFNTQPVIGLREGSWLYVKNTQITLKGILDARVFEYGKIPYEISPETDLSHLN
jgi:dipeptidase E